ncbi:hypothetical protein Tco_1320045 [Tanacetum coccineum]
MAYSQPRCTETLSGGIPRAQNYYPMLASGTFEELESLEILKPETINLSMNISVSISGNLWIYEFHGILWNNKHGHADVIHWSLDQRAPVHAGIVVSIRYTGEASGVALKGAKWPTQVDIPENDEREETLEQTETDEHENAHIPVAMAKEIKEIISQEVAKAPVASLSHLKEYFGNTISQTIKEELIANFTRRVKEVTYSDFSACDPPSYSGESNPFRCHRWIQDVEGTFDTSKCLDNL